MPVAEDTGTLITQKFLEASYSHFSGTGPLSYTSDDNIRLHTSRPQKRAQYAINSDEDGDSDFDESGKIITSATRRKYDHLAALKRFEIGMLARDHIRWRGGRNMCFPGGYALAVYKTIRTDYLPVKIESTPLAQLK